jgi:hypothetical protein
VGSVIGWQMTVPSEPFWVLTGATILTAQGLAFRPAGFWAIVAVTLVACAGDSLWLIGTLGTRQRRTADHLRSWVPAASDGIIHLAFMPSFALAGAATASIGPRGSYFVYGIAAGAASIELIPVWRWARRRRLESSLADVS